VLFLVEEKYCVAFKMFYKSVIFLETIFFNNIITLIMSISFDRKLAICLINFLSIFFGFYRKHFLWKQKGNRRLFFTNLMTRKYWSFFCSPTLFIWRLHVNMKWEKNLKLFRLLLIKHFLLREKKGFTLSFCSQIEN